MKSKCFLLQHCIVPFLNTHAEKITTKKINAAMWPKYDLSMGLWWKHSWRWEITQSWIGERIPCLLSSSDPWIKYYFLFLNKKLSKSFVFDICHNLRQESWGRRRQLKHWPASSKTRLREFLQRRWLSLTSWLSSYDILTVRGCLWYRGAYQ